MPACKWPRVRPAAQRGSRCARVGLPTVRQWRPTGVAEHSVTNPHLHAHDTPTGLMPISRTWRAARAVTCRQLLCGLMSSGTIRWTSIHCICSGHLRGEAPTADESVATTGGHGTCVDTRRCSPVCRFAGCASCCCSAGQPPRRLRDCMNTRNKVSWMLMLNYRRHGHSLLPTVASHIQA